jgi:hypothetical protein
MLFRFFLFRGHCPVTTLHVTIQVLKIQSHEFSSGWGLVVSFTTRLLYFRSPISDKYSKDARPGWDVEFKKQPFVPDGK